MHVSYRWSDIYATAPTLFSTAPTEDSDAEYEEHEGAKGTWMVECSCGNIWDGNAQCPDCGDYKFVFVERPWPTFARRVRNMRLLRGVARCAVRLQSAYMRAAERLHAPEGEAYFATKADFEDKQSLLMEGLPAKRARL